MQALIIPLNEYFFNHQKYDGMNPSVRFIFKHKWLYNFSNTKPGKIFIKYFIALPLAILGTLFFLGPIYLYHYILAGKKAANIKVDLTFAAMDKWMKKFERKNIQDSIAFFERNKMTLLVYYNAGMIPGKIVERKIFFKKIASMQSNLKVHHVFEANSKEDVEEVIKRFDLEPGKSFFISDGKIDLTLQAQLNDGLKYIDELTLKI